MEAAVKIAPGRFMPPKLDKDSTTERLGLVVPESWLNRVNEWRRKQPDIPSVSEAIRRLVDTQIAAESAAAPPARKPKK